MKKIIRLIVTLLCVVISIALVVLTIKVAKYIIKDTQKNTQTFDLSGFHGKIIKSDYAEIKTSIIAIPISEALKFGEDAILIYGKNGVKIWKASTYFPNTSLYAQVQPLDIEVGASFHTCKTTMESNKIIICTEANFINYFISSILFTALAIFTLALIFYTFFDRIFNVDGEIRD